LKVMSWCRQIMTAITVIITIITMISNH
jgi:hypothetical protein